MRESPLNGPLGTEAHFQEAQEAGGVGAWEWNLTTGRMAWSDQMFRLLGRTPDRSSLTVSDLIDAIHPDYRDTAGSAMAQFATRPGPLRIEVEVVGRGSEPRWLVLLGQVRADAKGTPARMHGIAIDSTARRQGEASIRDNEARLRLAMKAGGLATWEFDLETQVGTWSAEAAEMHGLPPSRLKMTAAEWASLRHPEDRAAASEAFRAAVAEGREFNSGSRIIRPNDGQLRWTAVQATVVAEGPGYPVRVVGVVRDVTERRRADADLRESEAKFRRVFEQSPLGKATVGSDFVLHSINPALCAMLGYSQDELTGQGFFGLMHPEGRSRGLELARALANDELPQIQLEERLIHHSGRPLWVAINIGPIRDLNGKFINSLVIIENIDERRRMSQSLYDSEQRLRELNEQLEKQVEERARQLASSRAQLQAFFDNSPDWLTLQRVTDQEDFVYVDLNATCQEAYGMPRHEVVGRTVEQVLGTEAAQVPVRYFRKCLETRQTQRYIAKRTMAGRTRTIDVMVVLVPTEHIGDDRFLITSARDITEWEGLQERLRHAQKMDAIGQLTGGVAHDFNNLLAVIVGNADLSRRRPDRDPQVLMGNILQAAHRGVALTRQLLSLSRRQVAERKVINLTREISRVEEMLRASLRGDITMEITVADETWPIEVDLGELELALLNMAVNARDAMPNGGRFTINVANCVHAEELSTEHIVITLKDTGVGMSQDVRAKAFEPFFTTKLPGVGTGLGLSQVYSFIHDSGGSISVDSDIGVGTRITMRIPRTLKSLESIEGDVTEGQFPQIGGRVLLVEDNAEVAEVTERMLREIGLDVEVAETAKEALDRLSSINTFDMLLSDIVMPGEINGLELARGLRKRKPSFPILMMSGYNSVGPVAENEFRVLRKPLSYLELRRAIQTTMPKR